MSSYPTRPWTDGQQWDTPNGLFVYKQGVGWGSVASSDVSAGLSEHVSALEAHHASQIRVGDSTSNGLATVEAELNAVRIALNTNVIPGATTQTFDAVTGVLTPTEVVDGLVVDVNSTAADWTLNLSEMPTQYPAVVWVKIDTRGTHTATFPANVVWDGPAPQASSWANGQRLVVRFTRVPLTDTIQGYVAFAGAVAVPAPVDPDPVPIPAELVSFSKHTTFGSVLNVPYPPNIVAGNTLTLVVGQGSRTITGQPAGFTLLTEVIEFASLSSWTRTATGSEAGTVAVTLSGTNQNVCYMTQTKGTPGPVSPIAASTSGSVGVGSVTAANSGLVLSFVTSKDSTSPFTTWSAPAGMTQIDQSTAEFNQQVGAFATQSVAAGATGTKTWTYVNGGAVKGFNLFIADPVGSSQVVPPAPAALFPTTATMAYDMWGAPFRSDGTSKPGYTLGAPPFGKHELVPIRINTGFDWYEGSRLGASPPWNDWIIPWGQLFIAQGNSVWNLRFQVRDVHLLYLGSDNIWRNIRNSASPNAEMSGAYWNTSFQAQSSPRVIRNESSRGGGWSVNLDLMQNNTNYSTWHWFYSSAYYPRPRVPAGTKAVFQACQARLITDGGDPTSDNARYVASFGSDHWPSELGGNPPGTQITPFMQPRMKRITSEWQWLTGHAFTSWKNSNFTNLGSSEILANPPTAWPTNG